MIDPHSWSPSPPRSDTGPPPGSDWGAWQMPSPYELLLSLQRHVGKIEGRQEFEARETRRHLAAQDQILCEVKQEVAELARRPAVRLVDPPQASSARSLRFLGECRSFLGAVASPREWAFGAILVAMMAFGVVDPETFRRWLFAVIGLPPI